HSVACLILELGRNDLFPEMLGFNSPTVTTPISLLKNKTCQCFRFQPYEASFFHTETSVLSETSVKPSIIPTVLTTQFSFRSHYSADRLFKDLSLAQKTMVE
ncbi:hypothetical protein TorRG33x02_076100, partial [Trema orientale]